MTKTTKKKKGGQKKPYESEVVGIRTPIPIRKKVEGLINKHVKPIIVEYKKNLLK